MESAFSGERWLPKSVLCLRTYDRHKFLLDAGVTVGLVALPLAMAFAIEIRRHPWRSTPFADSQVSCGADSRVAGTRFYRGHAGSNRVTNVGGRLRPHK